ncbi:MAG: cytochrome c3 family protein [Candidatus Acidiferrales bacterium]
MGPRHNSLSKLCVAAVCLFVAMGALGLRSFAKNQAASSSQSASQTPAATSASAEAPFYLHDFHLKQVGLDCDACHVAAKAGSVVLQRPGHDQCTPCHQDDFDKDIKKKICVQCHSVFPPTSSEDLLPFPRYKGQQPIVFDFSHARHVDPHTRVDARTGFRADCTFCHHFQDDGAYASFGNHVICAGCHSKAGMKPLLSEKSTTADCRGCHRPEEIENPSVATAHHQLASFVISGKYPQIQFSHAEHFKNRDAYHLDCTTCHYGIAESTHLANLDLPKMADCVNCHDISKTLGTNFRMSNCQVCHVDVKSGPMPEIHSTIVKPPSHTEAFRLHHGDQASQPGAPCFVCHMNVAPSAVGQQECIGCHEVMMPVSHTARWKDDVHGKFAALDRTNCSVCHVTDFCTRCHNETPRSHMPLAQFKAGGHAQLAMLNERSCFTCHTFADTCGECHSQTLKGTTNHQ